MPILCKNLQPFATLQLLLTPVLLVCIAAYAVISWRWPFVGDATIFHYVVFLAKSGEIPYRNIIDLNLPGTYAVHALVISFLGGGSHSWRVFDLGLLVASGVAMAVICHEMLRRRRIFPALFASAAFALIHGRDGLQQAGQRDLIMTVLLLGAYAFLFRAHSAKASKGWLTALAGCFAGAACTIKPVALLLVVGLVLFLALHRRRAAAAFAGQIGAFLAGACLPVGACAVYLARHHALLALWDIMTGLAPYHASLQRESLGFLALSAVSSVCLPLFLLWLPIFTTQRRSCGFHDQALLLGFLFGVASFLVQGRGYTYHRYPSEAFLLLLAAIAFSSAVQDNAERWVRATAIAGLLFGALILVPRSLVVLSRYQPTDPFADDLQADLTRLGGPALNHHVQCLDLAFGCLNGLDRMHLVQSSGFLYDCYLYPAVEPTRFLSQRERYRAAFEQAFAANTPSLIVVTSDDCRAEQDYRYRKLQRYPWLAQELAQHYTLIEDHIPYGTMRWSGAPRPPIGYRLYILRHSR